MLKTELYLGRSMTVGTETQTIDDKAFSQFLRDHVAPRVTAFTVLHGQGYWGGQHEPSTVLILISAEALRDQTSRLVQGIAEDYRRNFNQESVLVAETKITVWEL